MLAYQAQLTKLFHEVVPGEGSPEQHPPAQHTQHLKLKGTAKGDPGGWKGGFGVKDGRGGGMAFRLCIYYNASCWMLGHMIEASKRGDGNCSLNDTSLTVWPCFQTCKSFSPVADPEAVGITLLH